MKKTIATVFAAAIIIVAAGSALAADILNFQTGNNYADSATITSGSYAYTGFQSNVLNISSPLSFQNITATPTGTAIRATAAGNYSVVSYAIADTAGSFSFSGYQSNRGAIISASVAGSSISLAAIGSGPYAVNNNSIGVRVYGNYTSSTITR